MESIISLRGLALSKYKTIGEFAKAVGWTRNKASRIINGKQELNTQDIEDITKCLDIQSAQLFIQIFFASLSPMWTN